MEMPWFGDKIKLSMEILPGTAIKEVICWAVNYINKSKGMVKSIEFDFNSVHMVVDKDSTIGSLSKYYWDNLEKEEIK